MHNGHVFVADLDRWVKLDDAGDKLQPSTQNTPAAPSPSTQHPGVPSTRLATLDLHNLHSLERAPEVEVLNAVRGECLGLQAASEPDQKLQPHAHARSAPLFETVLEPCDHARAPSIHWHLHTQPSPDPNHTRARPLVFGVHLTAGAGRHPQHHGHQLADGAAHTTLGQWLCPMPEGTLLRLRRCSTSSLEEGAHVSADSSISTPWTWVALADDGNARAATTVPEGWGQLQLQSSAGTLDQPVCLTKTLGASTSLALEPCVGQSDALNASLCAQLFHVAGTRDHHHVADHQVPAACAAAMHPGKRDGTGGSEGEGEDWAEHVQALAERPHMLVNLGRGMCLDDRMGAARHTVLGIWACMYSGNQRFLYTADRQLVLVKGSAAKRRCLDARGVAAEDAVRLFPCIDPAPASQQWILEKKPLHGQMWLAVVSAVSGLCLDVRPVAPPTARGLPDDLRHSSPPTNVSAVYGAATLRVCSNNTVACSQRWRFSSAKTGVFDHLIEHVQVCICASASTCTLSWDVFFGRRQCLLYIQCPHLVEPLQSTQCH